ncbi:hypothetical protein EDD16DRAFT_1471158 [Pisolithus croceorrhizus]|nr:hypothetical protein EDD16DRAFT_1471158 [Pisolithus croceorrhizus]
MFGESDSESPRVPSPWDNLTSSPPTGALVQTIPRLIPEVEEGNVEYKLQLLAPSPARFARLVTQLKWRLLEGGGQAYYEIGVADSGALVGLPRPELEESLETLETMAGEIGASVIVVKEIEVPPALSGIAQSQLVHWEGRRKKRKDSLRATHNVDSSSATSTTEPETEASATDVTDTEDALDMPSAFPSITHIHCADLRTSHPSLSHESPDAVFNMDTDTEAATGVDGTCNIMPKDAMTVSMDLEISSVYKPRPVRKRTKHTSAPLSHHKWERRTSGKKTNQRKQHSSQPDHASVSTTTDGEGEGADIKESQPTLAKAQNRKPARDGRCGLKNSVPLTHVPTPQRHMAHQSCDSTLASEVASDASSLASKFEGLHVVVGPSTCRSTSPEASVDALDSDGRTVMAVRKTNNVGIANKEPRLIVEALVVRKMSLEDSFLDFGGFSFC